MPSLLDRTYNVGHLAFVMVGNPCATVMPRYASPNPESQCGGVISQTEPICDNLSDAQRQEVGQKRRRPSKHPHHLRHLYMFKRHGLETILTASGRRKPGLPHCEPTIDNPRRSNRIDQLQAPFRKCPDQELSHCGTCQLRITNRQYLPCYTSSQSRLRSHHFCSIWTPCDVLSSLEFSDNSRTNEFSYGCIATLIFADQHWIKKRASPVRHSSRLTHRILKISEEWVAAIADFRLLIPCLIKICSLYFPKINRFSLSS